jgi:hypothetical protein
MQIVALANNVNVFPLSFITPLKKQIIRQILKINDAVEAAKCDHFGTERK